MAEVDELERRRAALYARLAATGDFRAGSINETYRRCGKPNCACAQSGRRRSHSGSHLAVSWSAARPPHTDRLDHSLPVAPCRTAPERVAELR